MQHDSSAYKDVCIWQNAYEQTSTCHLTDVHISLKDHLTDQEWCPKHKQYKTKKQSSIPIL